MTCQLNHKSEGIDGKISIAVSRKAFSAIFVFVLLAAFGCRTSNSKDMAADLREFEDSADICQSVRNESQKRNSTHSGHSMAEDFSNLKAAELRILDELIDSFKTKKTNLSSGALGVIPGAGAEPEKNTLPNSMAAPRDDSGVCPDCQVAELESFLARYEQQKAKLLECSL